MLVTLLKEQFGDEYKVAAASMEKALGWPLIKTEDAQGIYAYSLFLNACCNIINDISYMQDLNLPSNMRTVVLKLPFKLREPWREGACVMMKSYKHRAHFSDMAEFTERQAKMAFDPVFGCIQDKQHFVVMTPSTQSHRGNSFATSVIYPVPTKSQQHGNHSVHVTNEKKSCLNCQENHDLAKSCKVTHKGKILTF